MIYCGMGVVHFPTRHPKVPLSERKLRKETCHIVVWVTMELVVALQTVVLWAVSSSMLKPLDWPYLPS